MEKNIIIDTVEYIDGGTVIDATYNGEAAIS